MSDDMVERVARKIAKALGDNLDFTFLSKSSWTHAKGIAVNGSFRDINAPFRSDYMDAARAAIAAMREPTREMNIKGFAALYEDVYPGDSVNLAEAYTAMIDAALVEK